MLLKGRLLLSPAQGGRGSERVKVSVKTKKVFRFCRNYLKSDLLTRFGGFECFFFFHILFNPFSAGKIEKLDF